MARDYPYLSLTDRGHVSREELVGGFSGRFLFGLAHLFAFGTRRTMARQRSVVLI
jgi:hypothetical protein